MTIRRLRIVWPDAAPFRDRDDRPIRILAVSDEPERALEIERNRKLLGPIDLVVGCGDLEPGYLCFVADAFRAPLAYVRGNHDRGLSWEAGRSSLPIALRPASAETIDGLPILGLEWPDVGDGRGRRRDDIAWRQVLRLGLGRVRARISGRSAVPLVLSHAPPRGIGDVPTDYYHTGFTAYRWLLRSLRPPLWLHGHTPPAAVAGRRLRAGSTTVVNVTGATLVELLRPGTVDGAAGEMVEAESVSVLPPDG
jgi:hypothetical protein